MGEVKALRAATFDDELGRVATKVGAPISQRDIGDDFVRLATGYGSDAPGAWQALGERARALAAPPPERVLYPKLAAAVREYFRASVKMHRGSSEGSDLAYYAADYLAQVPLREFRLASLRRAADAFAGNVVRAGLLVYKESPEEISALLRTDRYASRSHAAVILGLIGPGTQGCLEADLVSIMRRCKRPWMRARSRF